ncbi:hypothetical protein [Georgenia sp. Marseille-Q6866]
MTEDAHQEVAYRAVVGLQLAAHARLIDLSSPITAEALGLIASAAGLHGQVRWGAEARAAQDGDAWPTGYPILDATVELIESGGLQNVTFSNIAAITGVRVGALRSIFGTPERLLADQRSFVVDEILDDLLHPAGAHAVAKEMWSLTHHFYAMGLMLTLAGLSRQRIRDSVDPRLYARLRLQRAARNDDSAAGLLAALAAIDYHYVLPLRRPSGPRTPPEDVWQLLDELVSEKRDWTPADRSAAMTHQPGSGGTSCCTPDGGWVYGRRARRL